MINEFRGNYHFLSNFYTCCIRWKGIEYSSVECAFQAQKTKDEELRKYISTLNSSQAKSFGRKITPIREDWEEIKVPLMENLIFLKFSSIPKLKIALLATGEEELIEGNNWGDIFWGQCNGIGRNILGKILMEVRTKIRLKEAEIGEVS